MIVSHYLQDREESRDPTTDPSRSTQHPGREQTQWLFHIIYRIEKSREILPQILRAALNTPTGNKLNWLYFYQLLFTRKNLKLVHPVCHDKSGHEDAKCDRGQFYIKAWIK